jgi:HK97 gp10 family phage protein
MINVRLNTTQWVKIGTKLDRMAARAEKAGNAAAINKAATPMLAAAKQGAPVRTGKLKKSLVKRVKRVGGVVVGKIGIKPKTYGNRILHLVEFGTSKMVAKPFLRPAYYQTREESKEIYKREIWNDIQKYVRKERDKAGI